METDPTSTSDRRSPRVAIIALVGSAAAVLIAAAALFVATRDDADTVETADEAAELAGSTETTTGPPATTTAPTTAPPTTAEAEPTEVDPVDLAVWVGTYDWAEAVDGVGSDAVVVHRLTLDAVTNSGAAITGRLTQDGFQIATDLRVRAIPAADGIAVELVEVDRGKGIEVPGDLLFELTGDPARPLTTLRDLLTLRIDHPEAGTYFLPVGDDGDDEGLTDAGPPATFWAIEDSTYDLVSVETSTGEVVRRVAGWGPLLEDDELGGQALVDVEAGPEGIVWVSDCCEPAVGGLFGIGPDTTGIDDPLASALGVSPRISPDGRLVAMGILETGVQISDATTAEVLIAPELIGAVLARPTEAPGFALPLGWVAESVLAVSISDFESDRSTITFVDVAFAERPVAVAQMTIGGDIQHGSTRADGNLVVLVNSPDTQALNVIDPIDVSVIDRGPVIGETVSIDYDPSGRYLGLLDADGTLTVVGPDGIATEVPGRYIDVSW